MSCVDKRHMSQRAGSMLHHRFPNGFSELFMDETDREVSTLTDRAFRSLCIGDDAVYNDEFSYGYSPFSCRKPLVEEPPKKTHHKESKKQGQHHSQNGTNDAQPWKQQQQKNMSQVSSFLKALSATGESCEGLLNKNGGLKDSNGESWDKSALRSIQRELSEFSSDYHNNLTDGHFSHKNHHRHPSGDGSAKKTGKDVALASGKSSKTKNGKSTIKLRKLNIKNFFLHSEFSPFQTWRDFNQFPFGQEDIVTSILPTDNIPKWYDSLLYKELTEAHRKETLHTEEAQPCQKPAVEPPPPTAPKPIPPPPPPKVLPKPSATPAEKRCSSDGGDGTAAPWRRNRSRTKSAIPVNQAGILSPPQYSVSKTVEESLLSVKNEARSVEVKAVDEVSSLASTPFSICQLMTPLIPSRQPTETSEILQAFLSPSTLDLPLRPDSEAKLTPEPPVKRDSYKSLASSILFNLKDNRKRVKSRYSPPKFKTSELPDRGTQSPRLDLAKYTQAGSEGNASGFSTPAILKDGQTICSPVLDPSNTPTVGLRKYDTERPISDDYLISNLLQSKKEAAGSRSLGEENHFSPFIHSKKNKSPMANKKNYPSLNLYKKASPIDNEMKLLQVPLSTDALVNIDHLIEKNKGLSPHTPNTELSPIVVPTNTGLSPNIVQVNKELSPNIAPSTKAISPHVLEKEGLSSNLSVSKRHSPNVPDNAKRPVTDAKEKDFGAQPVSSKEKDISAQPMSTMDVIRAAREAINAAKNKALSAAQSESIKKPVSDIVELREKEIDEQVVYSKELISSNRETSVTERNNVLSPSRNEATNAAMVGKSGNVKREPPPVPKRNFAKSDIQLPLDKQQTLNDDTFSNGDLGNAKLDLPPKDNELIKKQGKFKHLFSARQNNYIKSQRYTGTEGEQEEEYEEDDLKVNTRMEDEEMMSPTEMKDSEHIINDLHALKELERARLGDHIHENAKNKLGVVNIDEETKAKNDLISRELRNIKRGMLSMRGNTLAKKDMFIKKEHEQSKHQTFSKIDGNVIVNKALINDNYDKAKMALEEIISERLKNKLSKDQDENPVLENTGDESYTTRVQQHKKAKKNSMMEANEKQNGSISTLREKEMKERLGDLRDHNHMKQILSQTEAKFGETRRSGSKIALPGMDRIESELNKLWTTKSKHRKDGQDKQMDNTYDPEDANVRHMVRQVFEDNGENVNENEGDSKKRDAPPVPPRSKKGVLRRDGSKDTESLNDAIEEEVSNKDSKYENAEVHSVKEMRSTGSGKQELDSNVSRKETVPNQSEIISTKEIWDVVNNEKIKPIAQTDGVVCETFAPSKHLQTENRLPCLSPREHGDENKANSRQTDLSPTREATSENCNPEPQEQRKVKRKAPLKPDHLNTSEPSNQEKTTNADDTVTKNQVAEEPDKIKRASEEMNLDEETLSEIPRKIISPLLLVNGVSVNQSPPDQASLSSKSSYFSVESALHRNTETESNVYHSLETLMGELEEVDEVTGNVSANLKRDSEMDYYSVSDHESEPEVGKRPVNSPQKEKEAPSKEGKEMDKDTSQAATSTLNVNNQTPMLPSNTFSPTLGIPALFKVKDNTFSHKTVKPLLPWSPRESLSGSEKGEQELHQIKETPELPLTNETAATSGSTTVPVEIFKPKDTLSHHSPVTPLSPSNLHESENPKKPQFGEFLTVPQEEDRNSGVSPSSEGVESVTSTADTGDEMGLSREVSKVPSERSGSTCSGNDSQTGLPKPPAVLPKSEKALLKAMKLTNRRIKKEEAQNKSSHKSSRSTSKHRPDKHRSENSEHKSSQHKSSSSTSRSGEKHSSSSSEKKHRERTEESRHHSESRRDKNSNDRSEQPLYERRGHSSENHHHNRTDHTSQKTGRRSHDGSESNSHNSEALPNVSTERQGRSSDRHIRDKPEHRNYSNDRVISNVPVYKAHVGERPIADRQYQRSQSFDRYVGDKVERRLSADISASEKFDPRSQRIEKSIMDELQQRGRVRDRASRDNALKRSHSIDAYGTEVSQPPSLSRQSSHTSHTSHTSQLSRQSSIEHAIVTQSFPMTQRKLLQDPDSGHYFFVDMPVQVKTKTFFDPETGNYVQLPVQPPEGAVPQPSTMEVLNPPLVVYHGFVPVPLSSMAQKSTIQASHVEQEEFEQRHLERSRQIHCKEGHPYLEPIYGQHDHMLGEFLGTEELDCAS